MDIEFTGRKVKMTAELRRMAEDGLEQIQKFADRGATAHVILSLQRHTVHAEVTVNARHHTIVGQAEASDPKAALREALDKTEKQAIRWKKTQVEKKRKGSPMKEMGAAVASDLAPRANGRGGKTGLAEKPPKAKKATGLHIVSAQECLAERPMTLEQAVKFAEMVNHEVLVFRDLAGDVKVLHCTGNGIVRLIEVEI